MFAIKILCITPDSLNHSLEMLFRLQALLHRLNSSFLPPCYQQLVVPYFKNSAAMKYNSVKSVLKSRFRVKRLPDNGWTRLLSGGEI
jgi:hypothetical protein